MESIGKQIGRLRQAAGVTQEKLGQALGVTTQAVSRWECGGTPDASMLPAIADFFHVSIDELFGRETGKGRQSLESRIAEELAACPKEKRFERAFALCRALRDGVLAEFMEKNLSLIAPEYGDDMGGEQVYSAVTENEGVLWMKLMKDDKYFFMMPEPKGGFGSIMDRPEEYERLFERLGRPGCMSVLMYVYRNNNRESPGFSAQWAAQGAGLPEGQTRELLQSLTEIDLLTCHRVRIDRDQKLDIYSLKQGAQLCVFLTLLCARLCIHHPNAFIPLWDCRLRPMLAEGVSEDEGRENPECVIG